MDGMSAGRLRAACTTLKRHLGAVMENSQVEYDAGLRLHTGSASHYAGIWPDDFLYPLIVDPAYLDGPTRQAVLDYLTASCADLDRVPDRVERGGLAVMQPGSLRSPHAQRMPLHLPAAWVRLLDYFETWGARIPRKEDWARLIERSFDQVPFSCGLAYVDPQSPGVGFGFHDPCAITGCELMSSLVLRRGLQRAASLFRDQAPPGVRQRWLRLADGIAANLRRLFDAQQGAYLAGSVDCRQVNVWGNGLAYWLSGPTERRSIAAWYAGNRSRIFLRGCTRQIAEAEGWQRQFTPLPAGTYTNGGYWPTGTGFVLPAIADQDAELAAELAGDLAAGIEAAGFCEWIAADGTPNGARQFVAALALPALALKSILEQRPLLEYL